MSKGIVATLMALCMGSAVFAGCSQSVRSEAPAAPSIVGKWKSAVTPFDAERAFQLDFDIKADTWDVDYTVFGDLKGRNPFVTVHISGPYSIGAPSGSVPGAYDAVFGITRKTVTAHSAGAAGYLDSVGGAVKGFKAGVPLDITQSGFPALGQYPVSMVSADYDLMKLDGDKLYFGDRPKDNNMGSPDKRPTSLASYYSVKY
ncbi:MAG: hypothetical protein VKO64_07425 [Candidatus Sericytochromatia bacterium]|nr:hypothetical protein [Candidatus Sericytochromatia bacterium]